MFKPPRFRIKDHDIFERENFLQKILQNYLPELQSVTLQSNVFYY